LETSVTAMNSRRI